MTIDKAELDLADLKAQVVTEQLRYNRLERAVQGLVATSEDVMKVTDKEVSEGISVRETWPELGRLYDALWPGWSEQ